jgi:beta-galactosidase/beta-glucuronidase
VSFGLAKDERWAKAGYDIADAQFKLPFAPPASTSNSSQMKPVKLAQDAKTVTVDGDGFRLVFDKSEGGIAQIVRDGVAMLAPGRGPMENYADRKRGSNVGLYSSNSRPMPSPWNAAITRTCAGPRSREPIFPV